MYSLYRAWFGTEENYLRLDHLSPPDTVVRVGNDGEYHFVAHRAVLAAHSGYLKALLATTATAAGANGSDSSTAEGSAATAPVITSVTVPSTIGGEAFGPLLHYMYTGRLEVTLDNIYTVLLATHLLHMPGALEQCRAALLRLRAPPVVPPTSTSPTPQQQSSGSGGGSNIFRPVPNRLLAPPFCWPQSSASHLYPPRHLDLPHLPALQLPPALSVLPTPLMTPHKTPISYSSKEPSISPASSNSQPAPAHHNSRSCSTSPELVVVSSASPATQTSDDRPSSTKIQRRSSVSPSSGGRISVSDTGSEHQQQQQNQQNRRRRQTQQQQQQRSGRSSSSQPERSSSSSSVNGNIVQTPGVVYDVACCDGPVRFHRVLNENYAPTAASAATAAAVQPPASIQHAHRILPSPCNGRSPPEECRAQENDENCQSLPVPTPLISNGNNNNNNNNKTNSDSGGSRSASYTCGYCRHTFKSRNCYRKHARRHLLPTENSAERLRPPSEPKKREVRLLDLNVQYYPCKICGSKFPSYYFVHKHRKLHHANVEEPRSDDGVDEEKKDLDMQPSTSENVQQRAA